MTDKLKFKDEETRDGVTGTEIREETDKKPTAKRKNPVIADDPPIDGETPIDDLAAEHDGGKETQDADASESVEPETEADNPVEVTTDESVNTVQSNKHSNTPRYDKFATVTHYLKRGSTALLR